MTNFFRDSPEFPTGHPAPATPTPNNLAVLPNWKEGPTVTLADRLHEIAMLARTKPDRFSRFVMCYREVLPNGNSKYRTLSFGCDLDQQVGMFEIGKAHVYEASSR